MPRPRAKFKVRQEASARQKELEEDVGPIEIRESTEKRIGRVRTIPTNELKNVIATTVQRVYGEEFGHPVDYINAREHYADQIVKILKYGYYDEHGYLHLAGGISMTDHNYGQPPLCDKHRR